MKNILIPCGIILTAGLILMIVSTLFLKAISFTPSDEEIIKNFKSFLHQKANEGQVVTVWVNTGRVLREDGERGRIFKIEMEPVDVLNNSQNLFFYKD